MIGSLRGVLELKRPPHLMIDVNGVGYEVQAPMSTIYQLPEIGQSLVLLIHFQVREDAQTLFGFISETERSLFKLLIKISGVGPKLALAILSSMEVASFIHCIEHNEISSLTRVPGVGKKTAERLLVEMRDKLSPNHSSAEPSLSLGHFNAISSPVQDAIQALISLGYRVDEASRVVKSLDLANASSDILIRKALQGLSKV